MMHAYSISITELEDELVPEEKEIPPEFDRMPVFDMSTRIVSPFGFLVHEPEDLLE